MPSKADWKLTFKSRTSLFLASTCSFSLSTSEGSFACSPSFFSSAFFSSLFASLFVSADSEYHLDAIRRGETVGAGATDARSSGDWARREAEATCADSLELAVLDDLKMVRDSILCAKGLEAIEQVANRREWAGDGDAEVVTMMLIQKVLMAHECHAWPELLPDVARAEGGRHAAIMAAAPAVSLRPTAFLYLNSVSHVLPASLFVMRGVSRAGLLLAKPLKGLVQMSPDRIPLRAFSATAASLSRMQQSTPAAYYRGGTSRGVMFQEKHLPKDDELRRSIFLQIMGTPDPNGRQLDGMGAGISSLSKICLIAPTDDPNADVTYTFVGVGIETPIVDLAGNCGNMSSAVGPYAFNERLLGDIDYEKEGTATVRIFNTNTRKYIRNSFPVANGQAQAQGDFAIDGVGGTGAKVTLDFLDPSGSKTGKLLPTGNAVDRFNGIEVSCIDAAGPSVFVSAKDIGVDGTILPNDFNKLPEKLELLEDIRRQAAVAMGMVKNPSDVPRVTPKIAIVSPSINHKILSGQTQDASTVDLVIRFLSDAQPHRAIPLTGALCVAAAAKVSGTVVQKHVVQNLVDPGMITIGHSSGRIQVTAAMNDRGEVEAASVFRTARRIMDGQVYWNG